MPFKVINFGTNQKLICDFLLLINANLSPILYQKLEWFSYLTMKTARSYLHSSGQNTTTCQRSVKTNNTSGEISTLFTDKTLYPWHLSASVYVRKRSCNVNRALNIIKTWYYFWTVFDYDNNYLKYYNIVHCIRDNELHRVISLISLWPTRRGSAQF